MNTKKKIIIVFTGAFELGGIERSLLGLLDSFDYEMVEVDLFLYGHHGPLFEEINKNVNVLPEVNELSYLRESFKTKVINRSYYAAMMRIRDALLSKFKKINMDETWAEIMRKYVVKIDKQYDLAIGFFRPFDLVSEKITAPIKMGWIHTDYSSVKEDWIRLQRDYEKVDIIAAVSEECKCTFCDKFPQFKKKVVVIENILSETYVQQQKVKFQVDKKEGIIYLLSIGRFTDAKNFDNVPNICKRIIEKGMNVIWYIIGFGGDEGLIKEKIHEEGMEEHVILLGKKENPYPYIDACDLYVQPSRYEGKSVTVREAQMLGKPVVITRYPTSSSQLEDGVDGVIVELDNETCAEGIVALLKDKEKMQMLSKNCLERDYSNSKEVEKIYQLLEG